MSFLFYNEMGLEKVGSPQANSNSPVNCLKDRGRVGKRERSRASPVIRSKIKGHRFGVLFVLQWGGLEKVGSPQANSNSPVNCLKDRGRVGKRERSRASPVIRSKNKQDTDLVFLLFYNEIWT